MVIKGTVAGLLACGVNAQTSDLKLWYEKPADRWEQEALPIGNGQMGAMIFGGIARERIQFNEETLWVGDEQDTGAYQAFGDVFVMFGDNARWPFVSSPLVKTNGVKETVAASCDGNNSTSWSVENVSSFPIVWEATIPSGPQKPLMSYTLVSSGKEPERDPKSWRFLGSQDGRNWTLLDEQKAVPLWTKWPVSHTYKFTNNTLYSCYRFEFLETQGGKHFKLNEVQLETIPLCLWSDLPKDANSEAVTQYRRELDIRRAIHTVSYECRGVKYNREFFASHPAKVIAARFTADRPASLTGIVLLTDMHAGQITAEGNKLISTGNLTGWTYWQGSSYKLALNYEAQVQIINDGGTVQVDGEKIIFRNVNTLTLFLATGTDYVQNRSKGWKGDLPKAKVEARLTAANKRGWADLMAEHIKDYQSLFNRVSIDLGASPSAGLPTDVRLARFATTHACDPQLEALLFQHGRYLMISSSRKGGLPANLQGKWNKSNTPPWRCDYHTDINVQMNYWPVEPCNLSECFGPYADWIESIRPVLTERTRKESGKRGWAIGAESGIFGGTTCFGYLSTSAWLLMNSYEHYLFTGDKDYLRTKAYPAMKELCEYWFDSLIEQPDRTLVTPLSHSPEHGPKAIGIAFDRQQVWELFNNTIEASRALGVDEEMRVKLSDMKSRILPPAIGSWGQLREWKDEITDRPLDGEGKDLDMPSNKHRHLSHLIAAFPGRQISPFRTPELAQAVRVSLNARGDKATGWSVAHKMNLWARLNDGERAYTLARLILSNYTMPNMFTMCAPFQIDANFGYSSGICEMLVQSHDREKGGLQTSDGENGTVVPVIHLLPALPSAWPNGSVKGLKARGVFEVDIEWSAGKLVQAQIKSLHGGACTIKYGNIVQNANIPKDKTFVFAPFKK